MYEINASFFPELYKHFPVMPSACDSMVDDIEDIVAKGTSVDDIRHPSGRNHVVPRAKRLTKTDIKKDLQADSFIPGLSGCLVLG